VKSIRDGLRSAVERAGLPFGRAVDGATFHTLRHTAASLPAELGQPEAIHKEVMGHRNIATMQRDTHLRSVDEIPAHERLADAVPIADLVTATRTRVAAELRARSQQHMSRPRPALGVDPLDTLLGESGATARLRERAVEPSSHRKVRATCHLPLGLVDEARNATVASDPPTRLTLALLVENGIRWELRDLQEQHNGGLEFPTRSGELVGGRPIEPLKGDRPR
jgi:hypothetical protein